MALQQARQTVGLGNQPYTGANVDTQPNRELQRNGWRQNGPERVGEERLARALGWFSIGLGLAEIAAPRQVAQLIGVPDNRNTRPVLQAVGLREITTGLGILGRRRPSGWLWARVGGDVMDLALLGSALKAENANWTKVVTAAAAVAGVAALDLLCSEQLSRRPDADAADGALHAKKSITVNRSPDEVYRFWHNFENLPRFMNHLESVRIIDEKRSHWVAKGPASMRVEWDAEVINDKPNELIAWRSLEGAEVDNSGMVRFERAPGGRGTIVRVELYYDPPGGVIGATIAKLFGEEPEQQLQDDLRRFKQIMEVGEIVQSDASIHTSAHPAQPPGDARGVATRR